MLTTIQKEIIKHKCPACEQGDLHEVEGENETLLYCNQCLCTVDSDGGYTN